MKKIFLILFLAAIQINAQDKFEGSLLDSVSISGYGNQLSVSKIPKSAYIITAKEINNHPVESMEDLFRLIPGMDIRTRGSKGVQADVSIRGGNFDQVLILLNGVPVSNPQTGHHSLDLPVDVSMIEKIEVLEGASGQSFGVNAYSGVINIITKNPWVNKAEAGIKIGQYNYLKTDWNLSHSKDKLSIFNGLTYQRSDGYLTKETINNTDFLNIKDFLNLIVETGNHPINIQVGYHQKDFGANSFYTSKYPWQYEKTKGYYALISKKTGKKIVFDHHFNYRLHLDEFQLFRESIYKYSDGFYVSEKDTAQYAPGFYYRGHNYHKTQVISGGTKTRFISKYGETNVQLELKQEKIWSNVLGKVLDQPILKTDGRVYTKSAERFYGTLGINQVKKVGNYHIGGGLQFLYNNKFKLFSSGGFYLNHINNGWTKYISVNSAVRIPSFTDLFYQGPSNIGNPDLKPERSFTYEGGIKYNQKKLYASMVLYYRQGINTIDWVKTNPSEKWQPKNLTRLDTYGTELFIKKAFSKDEFLKHLQISYAYIYMDKKEHADLISKYALDYLRHKFTGEISTHLFFGVDSNVQLIYKQRQGQYLDYIDNQYKLFDYQPYFLTHLKFIKEYKQTTWSLSIENLFDVDYRDLSYIKMPGRWVIFGLKYRFSK